MNGCACWSSVERVGSSPSSSGNRYNWTRAAGVPPKDKKIQHILQRVSLQGLCKICWVLPGWSDELSGHPGEIASYPSFLAGVEMHKLELQVLDLVYDRLYAKQACSSQSFPGACPERWEHQSKQGLWKVSADGELRQFQTIHERARKRGGG